MLPNLLIVKEDFYEEIEYKQIEKFLMASAGVVKRLCYQILRHRTRQKRKR
jgi:hypothetical protein